MHYVDTKFSEMVKSPGQGAAGTIVYVHGYCCDHSDWGFLTDAVSSQNIDIRQIAVDLPGHGESASGEGRIENFGSAVAELVTQLALDHPVLVGHSMGCRVVLEAASQCKQPLGGLVLVDGSRAATDESEIHAMRDALVDMGFRNFAGALFGQMFTELTDSTIRERIIDRALAHDAAWATGLWLDLVKWDVAAAPDRFKHTTIPVLAIQTTYLDTQRQRVPMGEGEETAFTRFVRERLQHPESGVDVMSGLGHFPQIEAPDALAMRITDFLQRIQAHT